MLQNRYLERWQRAGLIDEALAARIRAHEAETARPVWLWALAGIGALSLAIGFLSLIAANWDRLSAASKLAGLFALLLTLGAGLLFASLREMKWPREVLALLLGGAVLSGIALIAQIYQQGGPIWQALLFWLLICTPYLALLTRSRLLGGLWVLMLIATYLAWLSNYLPNADPGTYLLALWALGAGLALLAEAARLLPTKAPQAQVLASFGILAFLLLGSIAALPPLIAEGEHQVRPLGLAVFGTALLALFFWWRSGGGAAADHPFVAVPLAAIGCWLAAWALLLGFGAEALRDWNEGARNLPHFLAAILFVVFWAFIARLSLRAGRRGLFTLAFAVMAGRIFVFYLEAAGGLLESGLNMIAGGLFCLLFAWIGWRIARRRPAGGEGAS